MTMTKGWILLLLLLDQALLLYIVYSYVLVADPHKYDCIPSRGEILTRD
jgi:hypothetical protein